MTTMSCNNHPNEPFVARCRGCSEPFCEACLWGSGDEPRCPTCIEEATSPKTRRLSPSVWGFLILVVAGAMVWGAAVKLPALRAERNEARRAAVIDSLKEIGTLQAEFRVKDLDGDGVLDYASSLTELRKAGLIDESLASGTLGGYVFDLSGSQFEWKCIALPQAATSWAEEKFGIWTDGVVRPFPLDEEPTTDHDCSEH